MSRVEERRVYERDRDRRGDERIRYEDDELDYTTRRPAPPSRPRQRSPSPLAPGRYSERTFEDEERFLRERRYFDERDDRGRPHPPPVIPGDFDRPPPPPPGRPGMLVRRQSSLDTFDRRPARRAYDFDPRDRPPTRERSVERTSGRVTERDRGRFRDTELTSEFDELRIDSGRYRPSPTDHYFRETELVRTRRSSPGDADAGGDEYPKKGKTRMPARLVSERALIDLHYPFIREGNTYVVQMALGQDNINDVLRLSKDYKKSEDEVVEYTKTKVKTSSGVQVAKEERRREEYYSTPDRHYAPSPPRFALPPPPIPAAPVYSQAPMYERAHDTVEISGPANDYTTTVQIRDVSPTRDYATANYYNAPVTSTDLVPTRSFGPVIIDADGPPLEYDYHDDALAVVAVNDHHRHRSRHSRSRSRHRSHSHGDGALYARIHSRHHHHHDDGYYYKKKREYYESPGRQLIRAERRSNGELIVYEDDIEVEVPRPVVRIEKDKKGRMSISVPKYRS